MNENLKKLLRTIEVHFPSLLETKFELKRFVRNGLKIPFESDFHALLKKIRRGHWNIFCLAQKPDGLFPLQVRRNDTVRKRHL